MGDIHNKGPNGKFLATPKDDPRDRIGVEIGDTKSPSTFFPQVKVSRWGNEVNLSIRRINHGQKQPTVTQVGDQVVWTGESEEHRYYELSPSLEHPDGASEFEIILLEKPKTNTIEFSLQTKELSFFHQPPLTQAEITAGRFRPDHVIGSYALYTDSEKVNILGQKLYQAGKVGHIYRPKVIDANGREVWGTLNIDQQAGTLTVTIPQDFIDTAVYPIRHAAGLTFGYTSQGASDLLGTSGADAAGAMRGVGISGTATQIAGYFKMSTGSGGSSAWYQLDLNTETSSAPGATNLATSGLVTMTNTTYALKTLTVSLSLAGGNYWVIGEGFYNGKIGCLAYDSGGGTAGNAALQTDGGAWVTNSDRYSVFATYTAAAATASRRLSLLGVG